MDVLLSVFGLAASIVKKARQVSANKGACLQLSERVQKLNEHLEKLRSNKESDLSQQVIDNLGGLESTMQSIDAFLEEQSGTGAIVQFFMSTATREKLSTLHERIDRHMLDFQLTFVEITIAELDAEKAERGEMKTTLEKLLAEVQGLGEDVTDLRRSVNRKIAAKDKKQAAATSQEGSSKLQAAKQREHEFFWLLDPKDLEYETKKNGVRKILGKGGFSVVYPGTYMGQPVAIKTLYDDVKQFQSIFVGEVRVQYPLRHPNIVRLYGALYPRGGAKKKSTADEDVDDDDDDEEEDEYALVFERCERTLLDIIADQQQKVSLTTVQKLKISTGIVSGIVYLHNASPKVIHRDLKPHNVMLDRKLTAKLTDFGLAATRQSTMTTRGANASSTVAGYTDAYAPPEVLSSQAAVVDERCDVYSLGITLYELWMGHPAWGTGTNVADNVTKGMRPEFDCPIPPYVRSVIEACWAQRLEDRPHSCSIMAALISQQPIGVSSTKVSSGDRKLMEKAATKQHVEEIIAELRKYDNYKTENDCKSKSVLRYSSYFDAAKALLQMPADCITQKQLSVAYWAMARCCFHLDEKLKLPDGSEIGQRGLLLLAIKLDATNSAAYFTLSAHLSAPNEKVKLPDNTEVGQRGLYLLTIQHDPSNSCAYRSLGYTLAPDEKVKLPDGTKIGQHALYLLAKKKETPL